MKKILFSLFALGLSLSTFAQINTFTQQADSDADSKAILDEMRAKYTAYKSIEVDFTLTIDIPEQDPEIQNGTISQRGDAYNMALETQRIISDGTTLWYHVITNNEVQINTVDPEEEEDEDDMLSPKNFLKFYDSENFICAPVINGVEDGVNVRWIELKPTDADAEYFKMRLSLDARKPELREIKAFSRDGSRYTFKLNKLISNKIFKDSHFTFDASKFPGIRMEDLRID